jgi:xanthine/CO dehydrogenase XdhC/CoxF family maturation factor
VYFRFTLVLEGEQDVLGPSGGGATEDDLAALLKQLEQGNESAQELEDQVHWERSGVVCSACRSVVVRTLSAPPEVAGPH